MNVEKMIQEINGAIEFHLNCLDKGWDEMIANNQAEMRGMLRMLNIATGKTYEITRNGVKEA